MKNSYQNSKKGLQKMDVQKFLKIYSGEGVIFQPLNEEMENAFVDEIYSIEEVNGLGRKVENRWVVKEV